MPSWWSFGRRRHYNHERVDTEDVDIEATITTPTTSNDAVGDHQGSSSTTTNNTATAAGLEEQPPQVDNNNNNNNGLVLPFATDDINVDATNNTNTNNMPSLADLEEERAVVRRRTSLCVVLAVFVLVRLWVQALTTGDFGLLLLSMMGTHFCARFIRLTREREEALDRLIQEYNTNNNTNTNTPNDLRGMSFQSQLALAILESHRQMVQGGFGDHNNNGNNNGVSEQAKQQWKYFAYQDQQNEEDNNLKYTKDDFNNDNDNDHVHCCSICLGEYQVDEALVALPCHHVYHDECISSWCANHTRCPLCNFHLMMERHPTDLRPPSAEDDIHDID